MKHTTSSSSLGEPGGVECDSAAATTRIVDTNIPATVRKLNDDVLSLELLLDDLGGGQIAANNNGFW